MTSTPCFGSSPRCSVSMALFTFLFAFAPGAAPLRAEGALADAAAPTAEDAGAPADTDAADATETEGETKTTSDFPDWNSDGQVDLSDALLRLQDLMAGSADTVDQAGDGEEIGTFEEELLKVLRFIEELFEGGEVDTDILTYPGTVGLPSPSSSLRILTYNTAFFVVSEALETQTNEGKFLMEDEDRAVKIADGILNRTDADVVVLNEVFHEDARVPLIDHLAPTYPYYVSKLDMDVSSIKQDSGLMIFSKWPFVDLSGTDYLEANQPFSMEGTATTDQVGFVLFHLDPNGCSGWDCFASKGAGIVRVRNPYTGEVTNVVFTHLQASYGDDDLETSVERFINRRQQMIMIQQLIRGSLTGSELLNEWLFVCGDLNINGNAATWEQVYGVGPEWEYHFSDTYSYNSGHGFFACGNQTCDPAPGKSLLVDSWHYTTSPDDIGQTQGGVLEFTSPGEGERLDYILHSRAGGTSLTAPRSICAQHMTRAYDVGEDGGNQQWSDHLPVHGDFNRWADHCCPQAARQVAFSVQSTHDIHGWITYPGSIQWYLINEPGTYSMRTNNPDVLFDVYESDDLSRPVGPTEKVTDWGRVWILPEAPFYVRCFSPDRSYTGPYMITFHKHGGLSAEDAIGLTPGVEEDYYWPANAPINQDDKAWFFFETNVGDHGDFPLLQFFMNRPNIVTGYTMRVREDASQFPKIPFDAEGTNFGGLELFGEVTGLSAQQGGGDKIYYLTVKRQTPGTAVEKTTLRYLTNLTYFYPKKLQCVVENDGPGIDEIYYFFEVDGNGSATTSLTTSFSFFSDMEEGASPGAGKISVRKYVASIVLNLVEEDEGFNGANDYLEPRGSPHVAPGAAWRLAPLPGEEMEAHAVFTWADEANTDDADYWYHLYYELRHTAR